MAGRGGYQPPAKPAPTSGPGRLSRRTDGAQPVRSVSGLPYGEGQDFERQQASARMYEAPNMAAGGGGAPAGSPPPGGFGAGTARPDEPVTAGVDVGAGPGSEALGMSEADRIKEQDFERLRTYMPALEAAANSPGASRATRNFVRALKGAL